MLPNDDNITFGAGVKRIFCASAFLVRRVFLAWSARHRRTDRSGCAPQPSGQSRGAWSPALRPVRLVVVWLVLVLL